MMGSRTYNVGSSSPIRLVFEFGLMVERGDKGRKCAYGDGKKISILLRKKVREFPN